LSATTETLERGSWQPPKWSRRSSPSSSTSDNPTRAVAVLVVDDNESIRSSLTDILRTVGYTTIQAADGEDAMRLLTTMRFDVMVLDLRMPRIDGVSLLAALSKPPPVVVVSAYEMEDEARRRVGGKIFSYLSKPISPQHFLDVVAVATRIERRS